MRCFRCAASGLFALVFCIAATRAETPTTPPVPSPLRLMPEQADLLIQVPEPRRLVESLMAGDLIKQLQQLAAIQEVSDSTNAHRARQLLAYFEKEMGLPWPQLVDRLAGRGAVLGMVFQSLHENNKQFGVTPTALLLVIQGDDEKQMGTFFQLGVSILEQELARQEAKDKPIKGTYEGIETVSIGSSLYAATAGGALFLSNTELMLHAGLNHHLGRLKKSMADVSAVQDAIKLLPPQPLVCSWLNVAKLIQSPGAKAVYKAPPRDDPALTIGIGQYLDVIGRSPFGCAGVYRDKDGFVATFRMPSGREGMGADKLLHVPPAGATGTRPLLKPKNVLYSESNYFDIANIWKERDKLFNEKQARDLDNFEKKAAPFLIGTKFSKLLMQAGPYYRFVAAHQSKVGYQTTPKVSIPAFALVWEIREPEAFGKSVETILRGVALLTGNQVNLKIVEEKYKDYKLVGYRFPEDQPLKGDVNDLRFNFLPCFTRVGNQFVVSSTMELCRELVDLIQKEGKTPTRGQDSAMRASLFGPGAAAYLRTIEDLLVTQTTLDRAETPAEARQQIKGLFDLVRGLGELTLEACFHDKTFQYDVRIRLDSLAKPQTGKTEPRP